MNLPTHALDQPIYRFLSFEFQPKEHRLVSNHQEIALGARTLELLELLVANAGKLVTKETIFKSLWPQVVVEENNLHVHISILRKLIGPTSIVTISGKGYRFAERVTKNDSAPDWVIDKNIGALKILIIDDHSLIRDALKAVIHELVGRAIIFEAATMLEANGLLRRHTDFEMIILDLHLPDSNGIDFLSELREKYPHISIVIVSANCDQESVAMAMDRGAQGYIPKSTARSTMLHAFQLILAGDYYTPASDARLLQK